MDDVNHNQNCTKADRNDPLQSRSESQSKQTKSRKMEWAQLLGQHTHETIDGTKVNIWIRDGKYLARGSFQKQRFGEQLGKDPHEAASRLRLMMVDMENGVWVRSSDRIDRPLAMGVVPKLSVRELCNQLLADKRKSVGKKTAATYKDRLTPLIEFSEGIDVKKRWPLSSDVDRAFALEFKGFVSQRIVTRNGHPATKERLISGRHAFNILDCTRSVFNWGKKPENNKLPAYYINPFNVEIVGTRLNKDPFRPVVFPMEKRIELVGCMDAWQLTHFCIPLVLPLRPEDYTGLLIEEIDTQKHSFKFGTRFNGRDFNKTKVSFTVPYPAKLEPLLQICVGGRVAGPLLRKRIVFEGKRRVNLQIDLPVDVKNHIEQIFLKASTKTIQTPQDQKGLLRSTILKMGGVSCDSLSKEFKLVLERTGMPNHGRFYDLRGSTNTELNTAGVSHLFQLYVTAHKTGILGEYATLDPWKEMNKYFESIDPLLTAINRRAEQLGLEI